MTTRPRGERRICGKRALAEPERQKGEWQATQGLSRLNWGSCPPGQKLAAAPFPRALLLWFLNYSPLLLQLLSFPPTHFSIPSSFLLSSAYSELLFPYGFYSLYSPCGLTAAVSHWSGQLWWGHVVQSMTIFAEKELQSWHVSTLLSRSGPAQNTLPGTLGVV